MNNSNSSGDKSARDKILNTLLLISLVIAAICFLLDQCIGGCEKTKSGKSASTTTFGFFGSDDVDQYLGDWKCGSSIIRIEAKPQKKVRETHTLRDDSTATLLTPVRIRAIAGSESLWLMVREGIYEVEDKHALIFWCKLCQLYVIFGLERDGENLLVGLPRYRGFYDRHIHDQMWNHGQTRYMFRYSNMKWAKYRPWKPR